MLIYISDNNTLGLKYYADMKDAPLSDLLIQAIINTENQLMAFSDYSWKYFPDTSRITRAYNIFYQGGAIYDGKHVSGKFSQYIAESEYNTACTAGIALEHSRMLIHEFLNKYTDIVPEEGPIIRLDSKSAVCISNNGNDTKQIGHIDGRVNLVRNDEK